MAADSERRARETCFERDDLMVDSPVVGPCVPLTGKPPDLYIGTFQFLLKTKLGTTVIRSRSGSQNPCPQCLNVTKPVVSGQAF